MIKHNIFYMINKFFTIGGGSDTWFSRIGGNGSCSGSGNIKMKI